ncbi:MAG: hypothetical protein V3U86_09895 [Acidobacteriota bacterium]|nr:hypothetical protein [Acidobacteriota bacterium]
MDSKGTLERTCQQMENKYVVPDDFKRRIREILQPLFRHDLSADEMFAIEKALERTYVRHSQPVPEGADCARPAAPSEHLDSGQSQPPSDGALEAEVLATDLPGEHEESKSKKSGGVLLVRIDPKTKTASLMRMSAADVKKVLKNKAAFAEFLKDPQDDEETILH